MCTVWRSVLGVAQSNISSEVVRECAGGASLGQRQQRSGPRMAEELEVTMGNVTNTRTTFRPPSIAFLPRPAIVSFFIFREGLDYFTYLR